jgi:hypothetical protein
LELLEFGGAATRNPAKFVDGVWVLVLVTSVDSELSLEPVVKLPDADLDDARREDFARMADASDSLQPKMAILRQGSTPRGHSKPDVRALDQARRVAGEGQYWCRRRDAVGRTTDVLAVLRHH